MRYHVLSPEVAAMGLGNRTVVNASFHPPRVLHLHYDFDVWLGDDLVAAFPCFLVTERLAHELRASGLTGYELKSVELSKSDLFQDLYPGLDLPTFVWLDVNGSPGVDDFGVDKQGRLIVSDRALDILRRNNFRHCDVDNS
jgi:hypothetical protein